MLGALLVARVSALEQPTIQHFSLPFRIVAGTAATSEQDTLEEIRDCVEAILRTPKGSRVELPAFGIPDTTFSAAADAALIEQAVAEWEPRAAAAAAADNSSLSEFISTVTVAVSGGPA